VIGHRGQGRCHELAIAAAIHLHLAAAATVGAGHAEAVQQAPHPPPPRRLTAGISSTPGRARSWSHAPRGSRGEEEGREV
jgi:hypothetical protein